MKENVMNICEKFAAVENAKVANVKYKYYHVGTKGLLGVDDAAVVVVVSAVSVDLRNQKVTTTLKDASGNTYTREGEFYLYNSLADFENGNAIGRKIVAAWELLMWADWNRTEAFGTHDVPEFIPVVDVDDENGTSNVFLTVWAFVDGAAKRVSVKVDTVAWDDENGKHLLDGTMPDKFWHSKADVYKWNSYKLIDEDGDSFTEESAELRLTPTDKQNDAIKAVVDAFAKAKDAGLALLFDINDGDGKIYAINTANLVGDKTNATPAMLCGDRVDLNDVTITNTGASVEIFGSGDTILFKPTARQAKQWKKEHPAD